MRGRKISAPVTAAKRETTNTAPAAMSLAFFANIEK